MKQRTGLWLILVGMILGLTACGKSEQSVVPLPGTVNPFVGAKVGTDSTLEIATWNIEHFSKKGNETVTAVIQAVEAMDIDIIALQEIENVASFAQVRESLKSYDGYRATSAGYSLNLAFLYREDADLVVDDVYEILVEYNREFPRRPYVLQGRYKNRPLVVINNHYKCCGSGSIDESDLWDEETRRRDASLLLDEYIRTNFPGISVVVVGDFNDSLVDAPTKNVFQNFLDAPELYNFVDMSIAQGPRSGWSFPGYPSHLDHILITAPLFPAYQGKDTLVQVVPLNAFLRNYDPVISDHLPVVLKVGM
jgi:endonuclease/exonuclease/phosphatase family metal-dependent hydrolase